MYVCESVSRLSSCTWSMPRKQQHVVKRSPLFLFFRANLTHTCGTAFFVYTFQKLKQDFSRRKKETPTCWGGDSFVLQSIFPHALPPPSPPDLPPPPYNPAIEPPPLHSKSALSVAILVCVPREAGAQPGDGITQPTVGAGSNPLFHVAVHVGCESVELPDSRMLTLLRDVCVVDERRVHGFAIPEDWAVKLDLVPGSLNDNSGECGGW